MPDWKYQLFLSTIFAALLGGVVGLVVWWWFDAGWLSILIAVFWTVGVFRDLVEKDIELLSFASDGERAILEARRKRENEEATGV